MQGAQPGEVFVEKYLKDYLPINGDPAEAQKLFKEAVEALGYEAPTPPGK